MTDVPVGPGPNNLSSFMVNALSRGMGANATLRAWRDAGGHVDRTFGLKLFGELRSIPASATELARLDPAAIVPAGLTTPWRANGPGQYGYFVTVHGHNVGETDLIEIRTTVYTDRLISQQEAMERAAQDVIDLGESGTFAGFEPKGVHVTSVATLIGRGAA